MKNALRFIPDRSYIQVYFFLKNHRFANIDHPRSFSEKLQWYKLNYHNPLLQKHADKSAVRAYVEQTIGGQYLTPKYGEYSSFADIDFDRLPEQFVLKCTHDSQSAIVVREKSQIDRRKLSRHFNTALGRDWYWQGREWAYKNVPRKIIAEYLIPTEDGMVPEDFKFYCFDGKVKLVGVYSDRYTSRFGRHWFSPVWEYLGDGNLPGPASECPDDLKTPPSSLKDLLKMSESLSVGLPHVRVDWYVTETNVYFGELTFYTSGGFSHYHDKSTSFPDRLDMFLGAQFDVSPCNTP